MKQNQSPKYIAEIVNRARSSYFFGQKVYMPDNYKFSVVTDTVHHHKSIEMVKYKEEERGFPIIFFPQEQIAPKIHEHHALILKEFSAKFYMLKPLNPGTHSIRIYRNIGSNKLSFELENDKKLATIPLKKAECKFINDFIKKYGQYSTPHLCADGHYKFNRPIMHIEKFFSFYIPCSNHELLKGFETDYI